MQLIERMEPVVAEGPRNPGLLIRVLTDPFSLRPCNLADWDFLLSQARHCRLLPRLACLAEQAGIIQELPREVRPHLLTGRTIAAQHARLTRWEVNRLEQCLRGTSIPIALLKGAAYLIAGLPPARGRLCSDVDILVPRSSLDAIESLLRSRGYQDLDLDRYDQRYYRTWMHELPPLRHRDRTTPVDVHHNILPLTGRLHPDADALFAAALPVAGSIFRVLAPADMVLHSAAHFFQDGDLAGGLRDLIDIDDLLRHFGREQDFWQSLVPRAQTMDLARPLYYALRYTKRILGTPIPDPVMAAAEASRPAPPVLFLMDFCTGRALAAPHPDDMPSRLSALAAWCLYVRSHWLRMPPQLLAQHLTRKAFRRWIERWKRRREEQDIQHAKRDN
jgi:hypothetical protein